MQMEIFEKQVEPAYFFTHFIIIGYGIFYHSSNHTLPSEHIEFVYFFAPNFCQSLLQLSYSGLPHKCRNSDSY